ncbi:hydrogenase maturation protease [uncultured Microbulbifer sp.]|uniref:hydrogenase maturation protease n=1 Tax=uncultured Microbulbifer sp. TaxID=348147 RepID=UPI0025E12D4F|nr:hydrogenase maturation protease [uncultured Microbulbifer sp.]
MAVEYSASWVVISLGNRFRGDDSVGPYILHRLRSQLAGIAECIENSGDMTRLMEDWSGRRVCMVDALVDDSREVGDILRLDGLAEPMPESVSTTSSHGLNLGEAIELGRIMQALPLELKLFGICGRNFNTSAELSPAVIDAAVIVEKEILEQLIPQGGDHQCTNNP